MNVPRLHVHERTKIEGWPLHDSLLGLPSCSLIDRLEMSLCCVFRPARVSKNKLTLINYS